MVKVCYIISGDLWAGAEVMAFHLLKGLMRYKVLELSVVLLNEGKLAEEIRKLNIPLEVFNESKMSFFQIFSAIRKEAKRRPPDVIHSHRYKENILAYLVSKTKKGIKLIGTQHGMPEFYDGSGLKSRMILKLNFLVLSKCFQNVIAVSKDIQQTLINQNGFPEDKIKTIYNGIEIPDNIQIKKNKGAFVVGSSGRLFPVKDYHLMVEVAREFLKMKNNVRFELAGDGPEESKIKDLIRKFGLENRFLLRGFLKDMNTFYQGLDLYLNTSFHEGIPMSILEAMAHGLPVVAPRVGGIIEILSNQIEGYLVEGRNPKAFAEKCLRLYEDKMLRRQMGLLAREKVIKEFSINRMVEKYYDLYLNLIGIG